MQETIKPILKWAGGKRQLLPHLNKIIPKKFKNYIEPFIGGGAFFFNLNLKNSIIADTNWELINLYSEIAKNPKQIIKRLKEFKNTKNFFYKIRKQNPSSNLDRACRTIYLNKTCFNGLYRVNKNGDFNVPFAGNKNTSFVDEENLFRASTLLKKTKILNLSYDLVLKKYTKNNDLIFLDPPYLPISKYSDFKRYTKEQFYFEDHIKLAKLFNELHNKGCKLILTNSNSPKVIKLYKKFNILEVKTRRNINSKGNKRFGSDLIITNYEASF